MLLYHYTCDEGIRGITADGQTRPNPHRLLRGTPAVTWLTDMDVPDVGALGLSSRYITCDRTRHRLAVDSDDIPGLLHWPVAARQWHLSRRIRGYLETGQARPMHWWITTQPIDLLYATVTGDTGGRQCRSIRGPQVIAVH